MKGRDGSTCDVRDNVKNDDVLFDPIVYAPASSCRLDSFLPRALNTANIDIFFPVSDPLPLGGAWIGIVGRGGHQRTRNVPPPPSVLICMYWHEALRRNVRICRLSYQNRRVETGEGVGERPEVGVVQLEVIRGLAGYTNLVLPAEFQSRRLVLDVVEQPQALLLARCRPFDHVGEGADFVGDALHAGREDGIELA